MAEIILVRHGQASFGSDNYDCLSELGEKQARWAGEFLQRSGVKLDAIYSGSLQRQRQTAQGVVEIYSKAGVALPELIIDPRFNELDTAGQIHKLSPKLAESNASVGDLMAGASSDSKIYQKLLKQVFAHWVLDSPQVDGLQSWLEFKARTVSALEDLRIMQGKGKTTAVFTSGGVVATLVAYVMGLPDSKVYSVFEPVINASITRFLYSSKEISLSSYNEHCHLPLVSNNPKSITYR
jgi:broad specificity phosphatase PhoE